MSKKNNINIKTLVISAFLIALSFILGQIKFFQLPAGGSITAFSLLPISLTGYFFGIRFGVIVGIGVGLLNLIFGGYIIHPIQLLLDYPIAFGCVGLSGVFRDKKNGIALGYCLGVTCKYMCAVMSGIIFFASYAPKSFNPLLWSIYYNLTYTLIEGILTLILIFIAKQKIEKLKVYL